MFLVNITTQHYLPYSYFSKTPEPRIFITSSSSVLFPKGKQTSIFLITDLEALISIIVFLIVQPACSFGAIEGNVFQLVFLV